MAGSIYISAIGCFLIALLLTMAIVLPVAAAETPEVMLANVYRPHEDVTQFWVRDRRAVSRQQAAAILKAKVDCLAMNHIGIILKLKTTKTRQHEEQPR